MSAHHLPVGSLSWEFWESQTQDIWTGYKAKPHEVTSGSSGKRLKSIRKPDSETEINSSQATTRGEVVLDVLWLKLTPSSSKSNRGPWSSATLQPMNFIGRSHNKHFIESEEMPGNPSFTIHPSTDRETQPVKTKCHVYSLSSCSQGNWKLWSLEAARTPAGDLCLLRPEGKAGENGGRNRSAIAQKEGDPQRPGVRSSMP